MEKEKSKMKFSIIIPNNGRDISKLLQSLPKNEDLEIIHVDEGFERSKHRNIGIDRATGDAFLFLDSDQSISSDLIKEARELLQCGWSCIYVPEIIVSGTFFGKVRRFERSFYTGTEVDVPRIVIRSACPRFDESLNGPEDADWGNRIPGYRTVSRNVLYHHEEDLTLLGFLKKKAYYAKSMKRYKEKWPDDKVLDWKWRCFGVFLERGKWKKLLRHPVLSMCMFFIIFLRGIIYVNEQSNNMYSRA